LETNHHPDDEDLAVKIVLLWRYNTIIATFGVAITFLYSIVVSEIIGDKRLDTLAMVAILFAVGNITIRLCSYGYTTSQDRLDYNKPVLEEIKCRVHDAALSFIIGLWFLLFIGLGLSIYNDTGISGRMYPTATLDGGIGLTVFVIGTIFILSVISETLLWIWPFSVPQILVD
jgi:hypothetical protein